MTGLFDVEAFAQIPGQIALETDAPAPMLVARRVKFHEAKRHFAAGGTVMVSEYGDEITRDVYPSMTTHSRETIAWEALVADVREWRHRYPNQRYYVVGA